MNHSITARGFNWGNSILKSAVPVAIAALVLWTGAVPAQTVVTGETKVAAGMAPLDVLVAKDAILERWAQYTLLLDGDGIADRAAVWAEDSFTPDFKLKLYDVDSKLVFQANSQDEMRKGPQAALLASSRHVPITIRYDEITPTTANTRTVVLFVDVAKASVQGKADGVPGLDIPGVPQAAMAVYHDTWRKVDGKWLKSSTTIYAANKGLWPDSDVSRVSNAPNSPQLLNERTWARETTVAHGMSPLDVLVVKNEIRQRWSDYTLLLDGDGIERHSNEWAPSTFTPDLRWIWFDPEGRVARNLSSMEQMQRRFSGNPKEQGSSKHLPLSMKFDDITPVSAKTRTVIMFMQLPKAKEIGKPDGVPGLGVPGVPQVGIAVYHDTWRKVDGVWMKSESDLYGAQKGFWGSDYEP
jgi:hypothetical protein